MKGNSQTKSPASSPISSIENYVKRSQEELDKGRRDSAVDYMMNAILLDPQKCDSYIQNRRKYCQNNSLLAVPYAQEYKTADQCYQLSKRKYAEGDNKAAEAYLIAALKLCPHSISQYEDNLAKPQVGGNALPKLSDKQKVDLAQLFYGLSLVKSKERCSDIARLYLLAAIKLNKEFAKGYISMLLAETPFLELYPPLLLADEGYEIGLKLMDISINKKREKDLSSAKYYLLSAFLFHPKCVLKYLEHSSQENNPYPHLSVAKHEEVVEREALAKKFHQLMKIRIKNGIAKLEDYRASWNYISPIQDDISMETEDDSEPRYNPFPSETDLAPFYRDYTPSSIGVLSARPTTGEPSLRSNLSHSPATLVQATAVKPLVTSDRGPLPLSPAAPRTPKRKSQEEHGDGNGVTRRKAVVSPTHGENEQGNVNGVIWSEVVLNSNHSGDESLKHPLQEEFDNRMSVL